MTIVVGAGPAGLTAAYELAKLGLRATVVEADRQVGGLARTVAFRGYRFDVGGHRFFSKIPLVNELWREILGEDFLLRRRLSRIRYGGRMFAYPLRPLDALANLGPVEALRVGLSYAHAKAFPGREERSFEQWVANRFGHRLYEIFFKSYTEKVWGIPCSEISADWASQRIRNLSLGEALRNALLGTGRTRDGEIITTLIDQFQYPRLGPGMMWERCRDLCEARGVPTHCGLRIERFVHRDGRVRHAVARDEDGAPVELAGDDFIASMPIGDVVRALDPAAPGEVLRAANALRHRDYLTVVLIVRREHVFPDNWLYVHSPDVRVGRIQNYKNWSPAMVPDSSRTSLGLEYFLWGHDAEWTWPDERLIEHGVEECARIGLIEPGEVEDGTVLRMKHAYPIYDLDYAENLAIVRRHLARFPNLQIIGRNGQHRYNNQDHSMLAGVWAARNVAGAAYDVWEINTEQEYLESADRAPRPSDDRLVPSRLVPTPAGIDERLRRQLDAVFAPLDALALGVAFGVVGAVGLFIATAVLLFRGGPVVGPNLALLAHYLPGFGMSWTSAVMGAADAAIVGFGLGYVVAALRNGTMRAYALVARGRAERRRLLDRI